LLCIGSASHKTISITETEHTTLARSSEITGSRTSIYNLSEVYPGTIVARFYFEGFKDKYEGMNWKILWLVFEQKRTEWYLVGVVHGEWTI
jgi:hypothetical protein